MKTSNYTKWDVLGNVSAGLALTLLLLGIILDFFANTKTCSHVLIIVGWVFVVLEYLFYTLQNKQLKKERDNV
jgi:RsiW-degrading membrane proteinase PrsW (M82 family)